MEPPSPVWNKGLQNVGIGGFDKTEELKTWEIIKRRCLEGRN